MYCLGVSGRVCIGGGGISVSMIGCRRAGVDLVVGVGVVAAAGWRGPLASRGSRLPPAYGPLLGSISALVSSCERLVQPELSPFRRTFSKMENRQSYTLAEH